MLSRALYFIAVLLMLYTSFSFYPRWSQKGPEAAIAWDVSGYYWYLPSLFIYHDLKHQSFKDSVLDKYRPTNTDFQQAMKLPNGNYVMKYSSGMAVMYSPFFAIAHMLAGPLGYPNDGFSPPYQLAIQLGGFLISILGLWYLRKLLLIFYDDKVVAIVLGLLVIGSNYLNYAAIDCGACHTWLFTVYVFLLLNTHYFYQSFKLKYAVRIGMLIGLATLTRPTEIISCVIPFLWGMESVSGDAVRKQAKLLLQNSKAMLLAGVCAACIIGIQLVYWKYVSGHWLVYSYGDQGFSWRHPHVLLYSFNYKCGWLVYTPVMLLAIPGLILFLKGGKNKVAILVFMALYYYIVSAWNIWWYGGRAMIQGYPALMFPLAALVALCLRKKILLWVFVPVTMVFLFFNIWITWNYHRGQLYDSESMTKKYFWRVVGRWSAPANTVVLRDNTDLYEQQPREMHLAYQHDFEKDTVVCYTSQAIDGARSLLVNKERQESPIYSFPFTGAGAKWLRVQSTIRCSNKEWNVWKMSQFIVRLIDKNKPGNKIVKENMIRVSRLLDNGETKDISLDMELPQVHYDSVSIRFKNADSDESLVIGDVKVWTFNE